MADSIHCVRKTLRLMPKEAAQLSEKAKAAGMCEADYLRLLITQKPNDYPEIRVLLRKLINEVNAIGNNINQITRNHNSHIYRREDKELLTAYMKKLNLIINRIRMDMVKRGEMMSVEDVTEILPIDLIGAIPDDEQVVIGTNQGEAVVDMDSLAGKAYTNICRRITGEEVPFLDLDKQESLFYKLSHMFKRN